MLQFPTNIYPQNVAFDPDVADSNNALSFVFNGDILTTASFKIYNYATGELQSGSFYAPDNRVAWKYNGETIKFANGTLGDGLVSGEDYVIQMMLTQSLPDGSKNIYDMSTVRGEVQEDSVSTANTTVYLKEGIMNIYEWQELGGVCTPTYLNEYCAAGAQIQIGTERRFIMSYNRNTGELVVSAAFTQLPQKGDSYIIYTNYLVTPQYFFMCRSTPDATINTGVGNYGLDTSTAITASSSYSQSQECMIKYYTFRLYWYDREVSASSFVWRFLRESHKIYSQKVEWAFLKSLIGVDNATADGEPLELGDIWYKVECEIVTQEGMSITETKIFNIEADSTTESFTGDLSARITNAHMPDYKPYGSNSIHQTVVLHWNTNSPPNYKGTVYRRDLETNEVKYLGVSQSTYYFDYLVPNKGSFEYVLVPRHQTGEPYINSILTAQINVKMEGYSISALIPYGERTYGIDNYKIGQCWKFVGEIEDSTITQNINRATHVGLGNYSSVSSTDVNYSSGTLSAMIGAVDCSDRKYKDTIDMVNAWRKFITKNSIFLLKSQKGDVWVVNISDSPNVTYGEDYIDIPTTFSFSWAECCSLDDIQIIQ